MLLKPTTILLVTCLGISLVCHTTSLPLVESPSLESIIDISKISDKGERMKAFEKSAVEQVGQIIKSSMNTVADVDELIKKADAALNSLKASSESLDLEQFDFTKNFISEFNTARLNLFSARSDLVELSTTTVLLCENILIGIRDWQNEHSEALLKNQFVQLKRLVEMSKITLEKARGKYETLITAWINMSGDIEQFKTKINQALKKGTDENERWQKNLRNGVYGTVNSFVTAGMIIADIFGCLGFCSGLITTATWATSIASVESKIAEFETELNILERSVEKSFETLESLDKKTDQAIIVMRNELNLVIQWESATEIVENSLNDYTVEEMKQVLAFQNIFANSIEKLKIAAQAFYNNAAKENLEIDT